MTRDVVAAAGFAALVVLGLFCALSLAGQRKALSPPRRVHLLVILGVGLSLLAGLSHRDLWPFSTWSLMYLRLPADVQVRALVCVDSTGAAHAIDHRAWAPLTEEELLAWMDRRYPQLPLSLQDAARDTLLRRAEAARRRVRSGGQAAEPRSLLGRLAASSHMMHPRLWNRPADAPAAGCRALRLVERSWNVRDVAAGRGAIAERTVWQYPEP